MRRRAETGRIVDPVNGKVRKRPYAVPRSTISVETSIASLSVVTYRRNQRWAGSLSLRAALAELEARPGVTLRLFDISAPSNPRLIGEAPVPARPKAVSFNVAGDLLAVVGFFASNGLTNDAMRGRPFPLDL